MRFVFELSAPVKPVVFALAPTGPYKNRLVVDLYNKSQATTAFHQPKQRLKTVN